MKIKKEDNLYYFQDSTGLTCVLTETQMWAIHNFMHVESFVDLAQNNYDLEEEDAKIVGNRAYDIYLDYDSPEEGEALVEAYQEFLDEKENGV